MFRINRFLTLLVIVSLLLSACDLVAQPTATQQPTATTAVQPPTATVPPSATAVPPTATTAPPTATAVPPTATAAPVLEPLYLAVVWHQHQPIYYKDPTSGLYSKPWVRVHASKDYLDMAATLEKYPNVHATFNLTPSLIKQLDDYAAGAKDVYWAMAEKPAAGLSDADKRFILQRFFDANGKIIARFPRYQQLADMRKGAGDDQINAALKDWTAADYRDLQVLFNLAWTDPDWLAQAPLKALVDKGRGFSEEDKQIIFAEHLRIIKEVIPEHSKLQKAGQIEVTMTPYAHPILPLIFDSNLAALAMKTATLPNRFFWPVDAVAQVTKGVALYQEHFGVAPRGMWPGEGSVAPEITGIVGDAGIKWMATDEGVLANSLGVGSFSRDSQETVTRAGELYQPYLVQNGSSPAVAMIFRDQKISDKVGFTYSGVSGQAAANDLLGRLRAIAARLKEEKASGPHLVSIILDGENAWEYYDNDGKDFLASLYSQLSQASDIKTVTPSEFLAKYPATVKIDKLWAGSWINANFDTWIGEPEENTAWNYLGAARATLEKYISGVREVDKAGLDKARELMYSAEGSDWFWWYGADQNSGDDGAFDTMYRNTLVDLYRALKAEPPDNLFVPILAAAPANAQRAPQALLTPTIDGTAAAGEWDKAGAYGGAQGGAPAAISYGFDKNMLYLLLQSNQPWPSAGDFLGVYLNVPHYPASALFSRYGQRTTVLGFAATHELVVDAAKKTATLNRAKSDGSWVDSGARVAMGAGEQTIELAIPLAGLALRDEGSGSPLETGDNIMASVVVARAQKDVAQAPAGGPARFSVPDLGNVQPILTVRDAKGDDHGPGAYTYASDAVFKPGVYDIAQFSVGQEAGNYIFKVTFNGPVENVWGSPNGMSVQSIDIYIDADHTAGSGARRLLDARNAALAAADAWDWVVAAEGWTPAVYKVGKDGKPEKTDAPLTIITDPAGSVTIRVPKASLPGDPATWGLLCAVLGQDGYGPNRVRDVNPAAEQWRFGGGPADTNHTRIIDIAWEGTPSQEEMLSAYKPSKDANMDNVPVDDFAQVKMLRAK